ncbi:cyclin-dependent kinase-like [Sesbania bispinosa]|nr:cyclin-dependent kinase-like [Sesbania bispinosa]
MASSTVGDMAQVIYVGYPLSSMLKILFCSKHMKLYAEGKVIIKVIKSKHGSDMSISMRIIVRAPHSASYL